MHAPRSFAGEHRQNSKYQVAILLCTFNGERFLREQLESISRQSNSDWQVWASDDGSTDGTLPILHELQAAWGGDKLRILQGPRKGSSENFMSLVHNMAVKADFYAFCDQDDIWSPEKLQRAVDFLAQTPEHQPALYCSRTEFVDEDNQPMGFSQLFKRAPAFANALIQNIAGGNTMVFNNAARNMLLSVDPETPIVIHDWWTYLAVTSCNGAVRYDPCPTVRYRQHGTNQIGMNSGWRARAQRASQLMAGRLKQWNDCHVQALRALPLSPENREILHRFDRARRERGIVRRLRGIRRAGVYRQTRLGNLGIIVATIFRKI